MPLMDSSVPEVRTLMTGLIFGESPRWRDGHFWVSDWAAQEVIAVDQQRIATTRRRCRRCLRVIKLTVSYPLHNSVLPAG